MSLAKGRFGIEYNPRRRRDDSSGAGWVVQVILAVAAVSYTVTTVRRHISETHDEIEPPAAPRAIQTVPASVEMPLEAPETAVGAGTRAADAAPGATAPSSEQAAAEEETRLEDKHPAASTVPTAVAAAASAPATTPASSAAGVTAIAARPPRVKNLLLRLEAAEKDGNIPLAVTTIETLRALPGEPAADLDDALAKRLGELNERWLYELGGLQWVEVVTVRAGESATRIASAHGSTLASLIRLNGFKDANHIRVGQKLKVMNHPRVSLTVHKRARYADLQVNGKFFRRYDLTGEVAGAAGVYKLEGNPRGLFKRLGLTLSLRDRVGLETLMPKGATVVVSET